MSSVRNAPSGEKPGTVPLSISSSPEIQGASDSGVQFDLASLEDSTAVLGVFFDLSQSILGIVELEASDFRVHFVNNVSNRYSGLDAATFRGKTATEVGLPESIIKLWLDSMQRCLKRGASSNFEYAREYPAGVRHFSVTLNQLEIQTTTNPVFAYVAVDVTSLRESQLALARSEDLFRRAQEYAQMGCWNLDLISGNLHWSDSMHQLFGLGDAKMPSSRAEFLALVHPEDRDDLDRNIKTALAAGSAHHAEFRIITKAGELRWLEGRGQGICGLDGKPTAMLGIALDITRRKIAEEMFELQSVNMMNLSKMSALGEMAGGIAHEINNPLTIINANAALIKKILRLAPLDTNKLSRIATDLSATCQRIARIIEGLRFFARDGSDDTFSDSSLKSIVNDTLAFCTERFKTHGIDLVVQPISPHLTLYCQPVQISQVILNLLNNAHDACEDAPVKRVSILTAQQDSHIELIIEDSGPGLSPLLRGKLFSPFFTTKQVGKGTGLGLSIVKGIVEAHAGQVKYERLMDATRFVVTLPIGRVSKTGSIERS